MRELKTLPQSGRGTLLIKQVFKKYLSVGFLLISACSPEAITTKTNELYNVDVTVKEAKQWYSDIVKTKRGMVDKPQKDPVWRLAVNYGHYIEVPLVYDGKIPNPLFSQNDLDAISNKIKVLEPTEIHGQNTLVIGRWRGNYTGFIIKLIPTHGYATTHGDLFNNGKITHASLQENQFTGIVLHSDLNGVIKAGYQMQDGNFKGDIYPPDM